MEQVWWPPLELETEGDPSPTTTSADAASPPSQPPPLCDKTPPSGPLHFSPKSPSPLSLSSTFPSTYGHQSFADGKRTGNKVYWGKSGVGVNSKGETPVVGEVKSGQDMGNKKDSIKVTTDRSFKKAMAVTSYVNMAPKKIEESRFAVLSDNLDEESNVRKGQAPDYRVLIEISNKSVPNRRQLCPSASKYLVDSPMDTNVSKFPKENIIEKWVKKSRKSIKKMGHQSVTVHQSGIEEDVDDSEVLQSLHNKILETEMIGSQVSMAMKHNQIEVSDYANFDNVASKLKKAMEVALE
ncbi:hypothetical protein LWI29_020716 [Acer saccharum]|uniref:Uncharacterized protein n=1 Tax=Acer saccharum TaxID=4024 RepID=A0AA39VLE8_ACESA|nr:hypothetical protein LWI29_020716 [Acer saccharum]